MILLIGGGTHAGKTKLAQGLLEKYHYPYLSMDHLKMGLIRTGQTDLTPMSADEALTAYLWPIIREMVRTAVENAQNLIVEGCYIPSDWAKDFGAEYQNHIRCLFLILSRAYIESHFDDIMAHASDIEQRLDDDLNMDDLIRENEELLSQCQHHGCPYHLVENEYDIATELI